jgi:hypothetical protein
MNYYYKSYAKEEDLEEDGEITRIQTEARR